ncbi:MAG: NAD(P)/FAD-dependent oxidoreductase [Desulfurococcaceae archaeon]
MKYDVVVIGAGAGGAYTSLSLARAGLRVALVESKPKGKIGDKPCGDAIGKHHLESLGLALPKEAVVHRYRGVKVYSPSGKHSIEVLGEGVSVDRIAFGKWLVDSAVGAGAELFAGCAAREPRLSGDFVSSVEVACIDGRRLELEAGFFVDASGAVPALRSRLPRSWPISERPLTSDYNVAYREVVELEKPMEDVDYAVIHVDAAVAPGGYWWAFPKDAEGRVVNVGLGVVWTSGINPRTRFEESLRPLFRGRVLHTGGGLVPTRRPLPTLVWRNVAVVGDAAYTVNPVHGGGIGSTLEAASIVSRWIVKAFEEGKIDERATWPANKEYMEVYGAKQAGLDVLRMFLQMLANDDLEWIVSSGIVDGASLYEVSSAGKLGEALLRKISGTLRLLARPSMLSRLRMVRDYMEAARSLYLDEYPRTPDGLGEWQRRADALFREFAERIGYRLGQEVSWR